MKRYLWIVGLVFAVSGCVLESSGGSDSGSGTDAVPDSEEDASANGGSDSGCADCTDSGSDSGSDTSRNDSGSDSGSECASAGDCDDGLWCTVSETCAGGECLHGIPRNCDDGIACTTDFCQEIPSYDTGGCVHVANDASCKGGICTPEVGGCVYPESCNGADDDLDGVVDEGLTMPCETACGTGTVACVGGVYDPATCTAPAPEPESCDGLDSDCDGVADEGLLAPCETACGSGEMLCVGGVFAPETCSAPSPVPESCNGLDDDCNGVIDEGCTAPCSGTNLVANHSFEGTLDGWLNEVHPGMSATFLLDCAHATDGSCSAVVKSEPPGNYYDVQLKQIEVPTTSGMLYQLCLTLAAEAPRDVVIQYMEDDDPYATGGLWELISIDEYWREICFSFTATDISPSRLTLEVGADTEMVWVDDVRLRSCL